MNIDTKRVLVEELTYSGSAFGVLANGEGVFINSRIVEKMELSPGTAVYAQVLPNFTDKKDNIPWRVVNVVVDDVEEATFVQQIDVHADTSADDDVDVKIFDVLDEAKKPMTNREIFEATDLQDRKSVV